MTVYIDDVAIPYRHGLLPGTMIMCHMWADSELELLEFADKIGVQRKWIQRPPKANWVHFDIAKGKRALALKRGAVETDKFGPAEHVARLDIAAGRIEQGKRKLQQVAECRAAREFDEDRPAPVIARHPSFL